MTSTSITESTGQRFSLPPEVLEYIRSASFDGLKALPRRGAEVGGLIVGVPEPGEGAEEVRLIKCDYLFGPSFHLSPRDISELSEIAAQCKAEGKKVAAYFRSSTRPSVNVEPEDREAIGFICPEAPFVVIAKPAMSGRASVTVFSRGANGQWTPAEELEIAPSFRAPEPLEQPERAEPSDSQRLHGGPPPVPQPEPGQVVAIGSSEKPAWEKPVSHRPPAETADRRFHFVLYGALGVAVLATLLVLSGRLKSPGVETNEAVSAPPTAAVTPSESRSAERLPSETRPDGHTLGLSVVEENGKLHLQWSRDSLPARTSTAGQIVILDSTSTRSIPLLPADITSGSIIYSPRSPDVTFRMQLRNAQGHTEEEMIRIVGGTVRASSANPVVPAPQRASVQPPQFVTPSTTREAPPVSENRQTQLLTENRRTVDSPPASTPEPVQTRSAPPAQAPDRLPPQTAAPKPDSVGSSTPVTPSNASPANPAAGSPAVTDLTASRPVRVPEARPSAPAGASVSQQVVPPVPLHQSIPSKRGLPFLIYEPTKISILVLVDAAGRVVDARVDPSSRSNNAYLVGISVKSAREWKFRPATRGGQPVPGDYRIDFMYQATNRTP